LENLAKYIVRACFSQQRMIYIPVEKSSDIKHLGLLETRNHDPPPENSPYIPELTYDDSDCQIPANDDWT